MIKRVNSTGRKRISVENVEIEVFDGNPRTFNANIDLSTFHAPADAEVILEATCARSNVIRRFDFGTVSNVTPTGDRELHGLHGANVFFCLKVVDRTEKFGRILGLAKNIRPIKGGNMTETGRKGILPVESSDLGNELWRLDFKNEDVFLLVNERVPDLSDRMRSDVTIYSLIYPVIIRTILGKIAKDIECINLEEIGSWQVLWLDFARKLHPEKQSLPDDEGEEKIEEWIEEVVQEFCSDHHLADTFLKSDPGSSTWEATA